MKVSSYLIERAATITRGPAMLGGPTAVLFQAFGSTEGPPGHAWIEINGTNDKGRTWDVLGDIMLTLGREKTAGTLESVGGYAQVRARVRDISGIGASVSVYINGPLQVFASRDLTEEDNGQVLNAVADHLIVFSVSPMLLPGFSCTISQSGTGNVCVVPGVDISLLSANGRFSTIHHGATMRIFNVGPLTYAITGSTRP